MRILPVALFIAALFVSAGATAQVRALTVEVSASASLQVFGATAAYAVDSAIADAAAYQGAVTVFGRSAGKTQVIVVSMTGQNVYELTVTPRGGATSRAIVKPSPTRGRVETRYTSSQRRVQTTVDVVRVQPTQRTEIHVENVTYGAKANDRAAATLPSVSYRIFTRGRELTLFDRTIDHSPLTLSSTIVRGIHYRDANWRLHAGVTSYAAFQSFLVPTNRTTVLAAAYAIPIGPSAHITPGMFSYGARGTVGSLLFDYARGETLEARAELGYSGGLGGAAQLAYNDANDRVRVDVRYRPQGFASVSPSVEDGWYADAGWSREGSRASLDTSFNLADIELPRLQQRTMSASANGRYQVTKGITLLGGANAGSFGPTQSITIPAGVQFDRGRFGATAIGRWSRSSATNRGGLGFRVSGRAATTHLFATAFIDQQHEAPTLALLFREEPELALALTQLGITANSPADIARALRDNRALIELGYIDGVTIELAPSRTNAGLEVAWLGSGASRPQVRFRLLASRTERISSRSDTVIVTISGSRRLTDATDIFASLSYWTTRIAGRDAVVQPIAEIGIRHRFDQLPSLPGMSGSISGTVFLDENLDGKTDGSGIAGAEVRVDGETRTTTATDGSFTVRNLTRGSHRVSASVSSAPNAYFTTPSRVEASTGDRIEFGIAYTPARVFGRVVSDAGEPMNAVAVVLTQGTSRFAATTGSDGSFSIAAPPGDWQLAIDSATIPAGFSGAAPQLLSLDRNVPRSIAFLLRANRSISGVAPAGVREIIVHPTGVRVPVAADGRFSIRSLPAGEITLRAGKLVERVTLPREPATISGVVLSPTRK